jgi:methylated-DNA-[protein]-cysteine S-methyltransferase
MIKAIQSPIGKLYLQIEEGNLLAIHFTEPVKRIELVEDEFDDKVYQVAKKQLNEYFNGDRMTFDLPLSAKGTPFQTSVWEQLPLITYGETINYQELAIRIGNQNACRAVGQANRKNPLPIVIPCHRVIGKDKSLKGYAGSLTPIKKFLLELEEITKSRKCRF